MKPKANAWLLAIACAATGLAVGLIIDRGESPTGEHAPLTLPALQAHATASMAHDNFLIATGFVDDGVEALFFLDFMTGDLKATVLDARRKGFSAYYKYNISQDFNMGAVKNPKYLMVTGLARDLKIASPAGRLARSALYVVEATSGQMVAYGLAWDPSSYSSGRLQQSTFVPLASAALRTEFIRDQ